MYLPQVTAIPIFIAIIWLCTPDPTFLAKCLAAVGIQPTATTFSVMHLLMTALIACAIDEVRIRGPKELYESLRAYLEQKNLLPNDAPPSDAASSSTAGSINGQLRQQMLSNRAQI